MTQEDDRRPLPLPVATADWFHKQPEADEPIVCDYFDRGDVVAVFGKSKSYKSFFALQLAVRLATAGKHAEAVVPPIFLGMELAPKDHRVLLIQFEIKANEMLKRFQMIARDAMGLENWSSPLSIANYRGQHFDFNQDHHQIKKICDEFKPDLIIFDPLYLIGFFDENDTRAVKRVLNFFKSICEQVGSAVMYIHHEAKGSAAYMETTDRGSGSGLLGRDYDCAFYLSRHADGKSMVLESVCRNYASKSPVTISFDGSALSLEHDTRPRKETPETRRNKNQQADKPKLEEYAAEALSILHEHEQLPITIFRDKVRQIEIKGQRATQLIERGVVDLLLDDGRARTIEASRKLGKPKSIGLPEAIK